MFITEAMRAAWQTRYGSPEILKIELELSFDEFQMVRRSQRDNRAHDVTFFIVKENKLVLIKKHFFPAGAYRAPSGGLIRGETLETGTAREAYEETGLKISLRKYLLTIQANFYYAKENIFWVTDVFWADALTEHLQAHDTDEIAEVRWGTFDELQGPIRQALLNTDRALFRYRVVLTDATVKRLEEELSPQRLFKSIGDL
jgi:8-oxo-dGTP pyrophosphatase MutT (NUDIX family)